MDQIQLATICLARTTPLQGKEQVAEESNPGSQQPMHNGKNYCLIPPHKSWVRIGYLWSWMGKKVGNTDQRKMALDRNQKQMATDSHQREKTIHTHQRQLAVMLTSNMNQRQQATMCQTRTTPSQGKEQVAEESNPAPQQQIMWNGKNYCLIPPHKSQIRIGYLWSWEGRKKSATWTKDSWQQCALKGQLTWKERNKWQKKETLVLNNKCTMVETTVLYRHTKSESEWGTCGLGRKKAGNTDQRQLATMHLARTSHSQGKKQVAEESNPGP